MGYGDIEEMARQHIYYALNDHAQKLRDTSKDRDTRAIASYIEHFAAAHRHHTERIVVNLEDGPARRELYSRLEIERIIAEEKKGRR